MICDWCGRKDGDEIRSGNAVTVVKVSLVGTGSYRMTPLCQTCEAIEKKGHGTTDTRELRPAPESFKQGWQEAVNGALSKKDIWQ